MNLGFNYLLILVFVFTFNENKAQTITDILQCDTCNFYEKIQMIEANDREIFKNSQAYEQKRYNRYRTFYEGKIDSKGSLETYPVNMINFFQNLSYHNNALPFKFYNEEMKNVYAYSQGNHGIVHCVKSNPLNHNTLYAGSAMGGLFRTYNALDPNSQNVKWKNVTGNYFSSGVLDIEIDPADSNKIYICTGVHLTSLAADGDYGIGLYKSTDGGNTWSHILVLQPSQMIYIYSLAMDPNNSNTMYAVSHYRIYKTTNGWQSYTEINTGLGLNSGEDILEMIINPNNSNELYAFGHSVVLHSTDAGTTWTHVTSDVVYGTGYSVSRRFTMAWNTYDGLPYCLFYQNTGDPYDHGTIRKLISGTWQTVFTNFSYTPGYCLELQISPNGNIYGGGRYTYFYNGIQQIRLNSSSNFNEIHDDVRDIIFTGNTCFLATDGGVVRGTTDAYNGFMSINGNLNNGQFEGLSFAKTDPQILFAGGIDNGSRLRDNQGTWIHKFGCDGGKTVVDWSNSNILYTDQGCGGVSLATTASIPSPGNLPYYDTPIMQHKFISGIIFVGMNNYAKVYLPATNQWYNYGPFVDYSIITSMEMCNSDSLTQCLAYTYSWGGSSLYITHSGYQGFINRTSNIDAGVTPYAKIVDVEIHNLDPNKIWVAFGNFVDGKKIYYSSNGGVNWSNISYDLPNIPINSIVYDEVNGGCFVGTDGGIYYLADGTSSWIMMNLTDNLFPCAMVNELSISRENGELVVATLGRGAWKGDIFCPYDANIPINVTSTQTWPIGKKLTSDLVIDNNSTLTIKETLKVPDAATITVKNGSTLILDENSILQGACKEYYEGSIIVEPGGNLVLKDNSLVKLAGNGNIYIEDNSTTSGTLDYYPGVSIVLHDDNTAVNISGTLNIQPNANFTFTGSGYIKFSSPNWPSNNITYGSGSSITLSGSGQSDKIMEIAQETVFMPNCTLSNGLVYMQHPNARMQAASENTSMFLDNVKFSPLGTTRTQHRGVNVWGNQNCTISNCIFENGQYGIYAYLSYGGTSLSVSNCNFTNNTYGMWVHDKSFNSSTCTFTKNDYGIYAENTSVNNSKIDNCYFTGNPNRNKYPIRYMNCDGGLSIENTQIYDADATSLYSINSSGNYNLRLYCTTVSVPGTNTYALNLANGANLIMSTNTSRSGNCNITAAAPIRLTNAYNINIDNGYNYLNKSGSYHIYGNITAYACNGMPSLYFRNNQWNGTITNLVKNNNCSPSQNFTLITNPTATYTSCNNKSLIIENNETTQNSVQIINYADDAQDWQNEFNTNAQLFNGSFLEENPYNVQLLENSWENMRYCLKKMYGLKQLNGISNSEFNQTILANHKMQQLQKDNYYRLFQLKLEKATLYRMAGNYNKAIELVEELTSDTCASHKEQTDAWLCILQLEKRIAEGLIPPDQIENERANCPMFQEPVEEKTKSLQNNSSEINIDNSSWMKIIPNPASEQLTLCVNSESENPCEIEITNVLGEHVETISIAEGYSETVVSLDKYSKGIYIASLIKNGRKVIIERFSVVK